MAKKEEKKKVNFLAVCSGVVGLAGAIVWSKKDLAKGIVQLKKAKRGWVKIGEDPVVYLTANDDDSGLKLFNHLAESHWRLADQIADGYFWINDQDEILLLSRTEVFMGKYLTWVASRRFVDES